MFLLTVPLKDNKNSDIQIIGPINSLVCQTIYCLLVQLSLIFLHVPADKEASGTSRITRPLWDLK